MKSAINSLLPALFELTKKISDKLGKMVYLDPYCPSCCCKLPKKEYVLKMVESSIFVNIEIIVFNRIINIFAVS